MMSYIAILAPLVAACNAESMWNPDNVGPAIDAVEAALHKIVDNPHLTPTMMKSAKVVVHDVDAIVAELQSGKKLTKQAKAEKLGQAIQELQNLQTGWVNAAKAAVSVNTTALEEKESMLKKELDEKKAKLAKVENELKLDTVQKELLEKKLQLSKLLEQKEEAQQHAEEVSKQEIVTKLDAIANNSHASANESKAILSDVQAREAKVSAAIKSLDADEKAKEKELDETMKMSAPVKGKGDAIAKGKDMLAMLKKQVHREFKKGKVIKAGELRDLQQAEKDIQQANFKDLQKLVKKM